MCHNIHLKMRVFKYDNDDDNNDGDIDNDDGIHTGSTRLNRVILLD